MDKQQECAELMKAKCIREAHKAATNLEIEKAQTLYHEEIGRASCRERV